MNNQLKYTSEKLASGVSVIYVTWKDLSTVLGTNQDVPASYDNGKKSSKKGRNDQVPFYLEYIK